ncbi:MAG: hypothetical protein KJ928_06165 [Candidatus Altiarchaeota archaeon]|nr:hypothetical protein [Candidatus Altiarchaeota archaeon]
MRILPESIGSPHSINSATYEFNRLNSRGGKDDKKGGTLPPLLIKMRKKGQASLEYMIMLALALGVFAAILYVSTSLIISSSTQLGVDSAVRAVQEIKEASDFIYIRGHPSKTQIDVRIPGNIEEVSIGNYTVRLRISVADSYTDVYQVSKGNMTSDTSSICPDGNCREGYYVLSVESLPSGGSHDVNITTV